ncbi:hypothetical protein P1J78_19550 [Psychromarinibacter sp. C21-152]|uniref:Uncharacterized protein n=1 Tax=Psychromarinibacter sediminicola TaxID=3033385 RepID=A0AAE3NVC4_9RHOB|nr:hypothetical protein [Psychromarinibacter sediminicola]MDF0602944.1 hypothetical protein [Psychromarinibacter sediminicola]
MTYDEFMKLDREERLKACMNDLAFVAATADELVLSPPASLAEADARLEDVSKKVHLPPEKVREVIEAWEEEAEKAS